MQGCWKQWGPVGIPTLDQFSMRGTLHRFKKPGDREEWGTSVTMSSLFGGMKTGSYVEAVGAQHCAPKKAVRLETPYWFHHTVMFKETVKQSTSTAGCRWELKLGLLCTRPRGGPCEVVVEGEGSDPA